MAKQDDYVCTLTEASLKKAKEELYEDPPNRMGAVETLRKWVNDEPHIKCSTDTPYLLRFLRPSKFSQLEARKMFEKYMTSKMNHPKWMEKIDMQDKKIQAFLKTGVILVLPGYDNEGRKVMVYRMGRQDVSNKHFTKDDMIKSFVGATLAVLEDENVQVNGFSSFHDMTGFTTKQMNFLSVDDIRKIIKMYMGTFPTRLKIFHYYNTGAVFEAFMAICTPCMEQKMRDRIIVHGNNLENVYGVIPKKMLPVEYLPDDYTGPNAGTAEKVLEDTIKLVSNDKVRKRILYESGKDFGIDPSKKRVDVPVASFRSLSTD